MKISYLPFVRSATAMFCLFSLNSAATADELLTQAQKLIDAGKARAAFVLLAPQEDARAGDPAFDTLLGIAAIDSGQHSRGVFALERALSVAPDNHRARAEIARAYLALGETDSAREELKTVREQDIPPEVMRNIDRYLDAVDRIDTATRTTVRGYLEGTLGHDDNLNAGPRQGSIAIPAFGGLPFTIDKDSRASSSVFATAAGGATLRHPVNKNLALTAGISGWQKVGKHYSEYDTAAVDANAGILWSAERNTWSLTGQYNQIYLDDHRFRRASGLTAQWQHDYNARNQLTTFVQYAALDYAGQHIRDAHRWVYGAGYAHALRSGEIIYGSVYGINEKEKASQQSQLGHKGYGLRFGAQTAAGQPLVLFASAAFEARRYGGEEAIFLKTRHDRQFDISLGASWRFAREWSLTPRATYIKNRSNIELNAYERTIVSLTLRRDF
ncbi:surface lipoprotein assembly modifier [Azonexus hydrophilus]